MIEDAIDDMIAHLNGEEVPKDHVIAVQVVDATNVNDFVGFGDAVARRITKAPSARRAGMPPLRAPLKKRGGSHMEMLRMSGISKAFFGVTVLDDVDLTVRQGEVHALLGENGAGKSTLMNILAGVYTRDKGTVTFEGKEMHNITVQASGAGQHAI